MTKILFVVTSHEELGNTGKKTGFYLSEVTHPYDVFSRAGYEIDFVSPKGGKAPIDGMELEDPINKAFLDDADKVKQIENTLQPSQVDHKQYDAIFYAGGHGTMWDFPDNEHLAQIAANIYEQGGVVGAVCHGPAGIINIKLANGEYLIKGKTVTGFTNEEEAAVELTEAVPFLLESTLKAKGAEFTKAPNFETHVAKSDRLVTGQNPASAAGVAEQMLQLIEKTATATATTA